MLLKAGCHHATHESDKTAIERGLAWHNATSLTGYAGILSALARFRGLWSANPAVATAISTDLGLTPATLKTATTHQLIAAANQIIIKARI